MLRTPHSYTSRFGTFQLRQKKTHAVRAPEETVKTVTGAHQTERFKRTARTRPSHPATHIPSLSDTVFPSPDQHAHRDGRGRSMNELPARETTTSRQVRLFITGPGGAHRASLSEKVSLDCLQESPLAQRNSLELASSIHPTCLKNSVQVPLRLDDHRPASTHTQSQSAKSSCD